MMTIQEEISYLANAMSDEQRKAMFAKMGGGSGGGGNRQVYTRAGSGGGGGSSGGNTSARTVQTTRNAGSGGGSHYTQANDLTSNWVTSLSPDQMAQEYKNDPERLKKAIQEQINAGAYMGISINGHEPSVMDIINGGIAPNYTKPIEVKNLSERDFYAQKNDPMAGAEAVAIDPMTGKPMQEEQGSWEHLSPTQQAKQDVSETTTSSGSSSSGGSSAGDSVSLPDAIDNLPSGGGFGGDGGSSAPNYLQEFLDALALAHF